MEEFEVEFYQKNNGEYPALAFINAQPTKMRAKIYRQLHVLKEAGNALREPDSKFLGDGIFELRTKQGSDITRVLYFFFAGKRIVLTNGFVKKTDKTPPREIEKALKYREDYINRR